MADNYTQTSTMLKCSCAEAAKYLCDLLGDPTLVNPNYDEESGPCCAFKLEANNEVWVYSKDYFDVTLMINTLRKWLSKYPDESGLISVSYSCSKPIVDEFGGEVIAFAGGKVKYFDPVDIALKWVSKRSRTEEATE